MSKVKMLFRIMSLTLLVGCLLSCENDQDEIAPTEVLKDKYARWGCNNDNVKPVIKCKNQVLRRRRGSNMPDFISRFDVTATDNCGIASITQYPPYGTSIPLGATVITITATDKNGNRASCNDIVVIASEY